MGKKRTDIFEKLFGKDKDPFASLVKVLAVAIVLVVLSLVITAIATRGFSIPSGSLPGGETETRAEGTDSGSGQEQGAGKEEYPYATKTDMQSFTVSKEGQTGVEAGLVNAQNAILVDVDAMSSIAASGADERIIPASMTKVMTLVVLCDHLRSLEEEIVITEAVLKDPLVKGASGYIPEDKVGQTLTAEVLMYMIGVESSAPATLLLVDSVCEDRAQFVGWMNEKAAQIGCRDTKFTNPIGLNESGHYTTARDMASIMIYAMQNSLVKQILGAVSYKYQYSDGSRYTLYSTLFVTRFEKNGISTKLSNGLLIAAGKTGSEDFKEDGAQVYIHTLVTYARNTQTGHEYVAVTIFRTNTYGLSKTTAQDAVALYTRYVS